MLALIYPNTSSIAGALGVFTGLLTDRQQDPWTISSDIRRSGAHRINIPEKKPGFRLSSSESKTTQCCQDMLPPHPLLRISDSPHPPFMLPIKGSSHFYDSLSGLRRCSERLRGTNPDGAWEGGRLAWWAHRTTRKRVSLNKDEKGACGREAEYIMGTCVAALW